MFWILLGSAGSAQAYEVHLATRLQTISLPGELSAAARCGSTAYFLIRGSQSRSVFYLRGEKLVRIRNCGEPAQIIAMGTDLLVISRDQTCRLNGTRVIRRVRHQTDLARPHVVTRWFPLQQGGVLLFCNEDSLGGDPYGRLRHAPHEDLRYLKTIDSPLPADGPLLFSGSRDRCLFFARDRGVVHLRAYHPDHRVDRLISQNEITPSAAALSPDGDQLLVADRKSNRMRIVQIDTGTITDLPLPSSRFPSWAPEGDGFLLLEAGPAENRVILSDRAGHSRVVTTKADCLPPLWIDNARIGWFEKNGRQLVILTLPAGE